MSSPAAPPGLSGHGFSVRLPARWEGRIYQRPVPTSARTPAAVRGGAGALGWGGELPAPVLHVANFALPAGRGDYGTGAVDVMGPQHAFVALVEFGPDEVSTPLFPDGPLPRPAPDEFSPSALQKIIRGQAGCQRFFTLHGRPLCLYVVLGAYASAWTMADQVSRVLDGVEVTPR